MGSAALPITAGTEAPGQTRQSFSSSGGVSINTGATVNLRTVPAATQLRLTDIHVSTDSSTPFLVQLKDGSTVIVEAYISSTAPLELAGLETQPIIQATDVLSIVFPTVAGKNGAYWISGWEQ